MTSLCVVGINLLGFNAKNGRPIHNTPVKAFLDVLLGLLGQLDNLSRFHPPHVAAARVEAGPAGAAVVVHDGMHDLVPLVPELLCPA